MWTYLGQNFLVDVKIRTYIADKISALYTSLWCNALIEIWPGKWSITKLITNISPNFFVVEKDKLMVEKLKEGNIDIKNFIEWDVLDVDVKALLKANNLDSKTTLVVGNLPYYITSPILRKFFGAEDPATSAGICFAGGIFMVQDEVGQKLKSDAQKKSYLWWLLNYSCDITYLKGVPAKCFKPAPKVKSCLIQLILKEQQPTISFEILVQFLELFAPFSRKTLWAIQKMIQKKSDISFDIPTTLISKRLEELSWDDLTTILSNWAIEK